MFDWWESGLSPYGGTTVCVNHEWDKALLQKLDPTD